MRKMGRTSRTDVKQEGIDNLQKVKQNMSRAFFFFHTSYYETGVEHTKMLGPPEVKEVRELITAQINRPLSNQQ